MQQEVAYEQAISRRYPEQVVIGIVRDAKGKYNPVTIGWTMTASGEPPMMVIALAPQRYSLEAIRQAKEFVIAYPSEKQQAEALLFGTKSGRELDKFAEAKTKLERAKKIDGVLMADAVANFECKLVREITTGDHILVLAQVVCSHINEKQLGRLYSFGEEAGMAGVVKLNEST